MRRHDRGVSLLELIIVVSILAILATAGVPMYQRSVQHARMIKTMADLKLMVQDIEVFNLQNGSYPLTLAEVGHDQRRDPWGRPWEYLNFETVNGKGPLRKDHNLVPINRFFDLYSKGPDGKSVPPLTGLASRDDIIVGRDGQYIGPASGF